jgi:hypothetical protein
MPTLNALVAARAPARRRAARFLLAAIAGTALLAGTAAQAASVSCNDIAGWGGSSPEFPDGRLRSFDACFSRLEPATGGLLIAEADSDRGIVRGAATVVLPAGVSHSATSVSSWAEELWVINHPDPLQQGTSGLLRFAFFIQGTLDATGAGQASVALQIEGNRTPEQNLFSIGANSGTGPKVVNAFVESAVFFTFGESSNFTFRLLTTAQRRAGAAGEGFAEAIFSNSGYWGGVVGVEDGNGALTGFTFAGPDPGFESTFTTSTIPAVVPVPASVWLLGTAVAGVVARFRGRKRA